MEKERKNAMEMGKEKKTKNKESPKEKSWRTLSVSKRQTYKVKDIRLAHSGANQLAWAEAHMPALIAIRDEYKRSKPLEGLRIAAALHVTKETGVLARTLKTMGAELYLTASNPMSTQDDVAAILASEGIHVFAWKGETDKEYYDNLKRVLESKPNLIIDDGGDLHIALHEVYKNIKLIGGTEETTTGVNRLKALQKAGLMRYPIISVNDANTKYLFDNRYGTGQSTIDGILRSTNVLIAGKCAVVVGYGWVGRGIAMRFHGLGARVIVTEINPFRALEALMDGFDVMPISKAAPIGDIFVTATGNKNVIPISVINKMKDGAILANSGHFDVEIDVNSLKNTSSSVKTIRQYLDEYTLKNKHKIYLLAEGRLVNLGAAEGHPSEVMDLSFSNQALSILYLVNNKLPPNLYNVLGEIDEKVARLKLSGIGISIDSVSEEQERYMSGWKMGT